MSFVIAVPSYKRVKLIQEKTLRLLEQHDLLDRTTVFVANQEEFIEYFAAIGSKVKIIVGVPTIGMQRKYIYSYYPEGTYILSIDDDIQDVIGLQKKAVDTFGLKALINFGFLTCEKEKARIWGLYPIANPFFMQSRPYHSTTLCYICAAFYGTIKRGSMPPQPDSSSKEDIWRSCSYYKEDGAIVRLNHFAIVTKYYLKSGGLFAEGRTRETDLVGCNRIKEAFPTYVDIFFRGKEEWPEIRFRRQPKIERPPAPTL